MGQDEGGLNIIARWERNICQKVQSGLLMER